MGVHLECRKGGSMNLGYGGFFRLRQTVAELCSDEFGKHYATLTDGLKLHGKEREKFYEDFNKKTEELIKDKKVHYKVASFCLQSDCDGKISYGSCKKLYECIKDYNDNINYGYSAHADEDAKFEHFKKIVKECADLKCDLVWY